MKIYTCREGDAPFSTPGRFRLGSSTDGIFYRRSRIYTKGTGVLINTEVLPGRRDIVSRIEVRSRMPLSGR